MVNQRAPISHVLKERLASHAFAHFLCFTLPMPKVSVKVAVLNKKVAKPLGVLSTVNSLHFLQLDGHTVCDTVCSTYPVKTIKTENVSSCQISLKVACSN